LPEKISVKFQFAYLDITSRVDLHYLVNLLDTSALKKALKIWKETMGIIHKFTGEWNEALSWDGSRSRAYRSEDVASVTETWIIGKAEGAKNFAMRYYTLDVGGFTRREQHNHDHGVFILHGEGEVILGNDTFMISQGDVIYIPPNLEHQLTNRGQTSMGFLCIIPAKREKQGEIVWAEENIRFD
jgi:quercetin dioxygenase-like cupin family protein